MDQRGNFVVVWISQEQDGSGDGIFAQRFNKKGEPQGVEFQVNTYTLGNQWFPQIGMSIKGKFIIVWESVDQDGSDGGVYAQRYAKNGDPIDTEFRANNFTKGNQGTPSAAMDNNGNFVITWESWKQGGQKYDIFARCYTKYGVPRSKEFRVNTYKADSQIHPKVAVDKPGNFTIVWESFGQDFTAGGVYGQRFFKKGKKNGDEFQVNTFTHDNQGAPNVKMDYKGNFVIVWESWAQDGDDYGIFGKTYRK
jgi:uncharacterized protein YxeA